MVDLKAEFHRHWPELVEQVKDNTRLRVCLWIIAFILLAYPILLISDYKEAMVVELDRALEKEAKILRTANEKEWFDRAETLQQLQSNVESQFGEAESLGTAKAATFQTLRTWASDAKVNDAQIKLEDAVMVDEANGIYRISGQISAAFELDSSFAFLEKLETNEQKIVVERMEVSQRTRPIFKLVIATYFKVNRN